MTCDVTAVTDAWDNQLEERLAWVISTTGNSGNTILLTGTARPYTTLHAGCVEATP